jgi:uncharacterized protein YjbI with pentapeptide repeats
MSKALKVPAIQMTLAVLAPIAVIATVTVVVKWAPQWLAPTHGLSSSDRAAELGRVRTSLLAILAGMIASVGAVYTARTFALNRQGQITERFTRAIDQLGHEQIDVSLGGIYALERIARESKVDHGPVMEILTGYLREHSPWPPRKQSNSGGSASDTLHDSDPEGQTSADSGKGEQPEAQSRLATDIEAALSVIARRRLEHDAPRPFNLSSVDLRGGDFYGTTLHNANFAQANLARAYLRGTNLTGAHLTETNLARAYLRGANLTEANLRGAKLGGAYLFGTDLSRAYLGMAYFSGANLTGANLTEANLGGANLSMANLRSACLGMADLTGANLGGADVTVADLTRAKLTGADLTGANLTGANLTEANLTRAKLTGACVTEAKLTEVNLTEASLTEADLTGADLRGADLTEADFVGAVYSDWTMWPAEFDPVARGARRVE